MHRRQAVRGRIVRDRACKCLIRQNQDRLDRTGKSDGSGMGLLGNF